MISTLVDLWSVPDPVGQPAQPPIPPPAQPADRPAAAIAPVKPGPRAVVPVPAVLREVMATRPQASWATRARAAAKVRCDIFLFQTLFRQRWIADLPRRSDRIGMRLRVAVLRLRLQTRRGLALLAAYRPRAARVWQPETPPRDVSPAQA